MCDENPILKEIDEVLCKHDDRDAIVQLKLNNQPQILKYKDVGKLCRSIQENLDETIRNCVVGLYMEHNVLIPSIIICLQRRNCPFMFIDANANHLELHFIISHNVELDLEGYTLLSTLNILDEKLFVHKSKNKYLFEYCDINYIVQTSGTTGTQKIVRVEHYCIYSNVKSLRKKLDVTCDDIIYFGTILTFDPSIIELYLALTTGSCLIIVSKDIKSQLSLLYKFLFQSDCYDNITVLQMCPSVFTRWGLDEINYILKESQLRALVLGGEDFPSILRSFQGNKTRIYNVYGITEVSCWAFIDEFKIGTEISLGTPLDEIFYELRDKNGRIIKNGEGELFIGSNKRICYIDNETINSLSRPVFRKTGDLVLIENNTIFYRSRTNNLFKRFGKRINISLIEDLIFKETCLQNKIIYLESKQKLVLFVKLLETDKSVLIRICDKLKVKLLHVLDRYNIPDHIEAIGAFPVTNNGKIDQNKLILVAESVMNCNKTGKNEIEAFEYLWKKYLINSNSDKNFYDLGGTSILRIQFSNEFKELTNFEPPNNFFDFIFTNTYDNSIKFLLNYKFKRKIIHLDQNIEMKRLKKVDDSTMRIKWVFNLEACVDCTATVLPQKNFVAVGAFSNIFAIINIENGEEMSKIVLPNAIESSCLSSKCGCFVFVGCYDGKLYCIDSMTCQIKWCFQTDDRIKNTPCFIEENKLVFCSYDGFLYCLDTNGVLSWKINLKEAVTAKVVLFNKNIFVASIHGSCILVNKNGDVLWENKVSSPIFSSPCLFDNNIIVAEVLGKVHCLNQNGVKKWTVTINGHIYSPITRHENNILFTCQDHNVYCLEVKDSIADVKFKVLLDSTSCSAVDICIHNNQTFLITSSKCGHIYLIDFEKECIVNKFRLNGDVFSSPIVYKNYVFVGCRDNNLYCIELE